MLQLIINSSKSIVKNIIISTHVFILNYFALSKNKIANMNVKSNKQLIICFNKTQHCPHMKHIKPAHIIHNPFFAFYEILCHVQIPHHQLS